MWSAPRIDIVILNIDCMCHDILLEASFCLASLAKVSTRKNHASKYTMLPWEV